ncbi:MAG: hypothetical protein ACTSVI_15185 [Promethearchaeota archaeon]
MKFSTRTKKIYSKPSKVQDELPLIASLSFEELENVTESIEITPIVCQNCGAVLLDTNLITNDSKIGLSFKCQYCGSVNKIGKIPEKYPTGADIEYILEKKDTSQDSELSTIKRKGEDLLTAIIDVSGSMYGGRIEAVKHNLIETLKDMISNSPQSVFLLITFESQVEIFLSPKERAIVINRDDLLHSTEVLKKYIKEKIKHKEMQVIKNNGKDWISQVKSLVSLNSTALGPALFSGIQILLTKKIKGRILLLTDGLANEGFGRLEGAPKRESKKFYDTLAKQCLDNGILVDVVGVGTTNEVALDILGRLSELTGGELFFVSEDELEETFGNLIARKFVGRNVQVKVFTPEGIDIAEITGISSDAEKAKRFEEIKVGSVTADRESYIKLSVKKELKEKDVPIQVQVEFEDSDGNKKLRVFKTSLKPIDDEKEYKKDYIPKNLAVMQIQKAGSSYGAGDAVQAKKLLNNTLNVFKSISLNDNIEFEESEAFIDDELEKIEELEYEKQSMAKASFSASVGQSLSRMSFKQKKAELKKRKKKSK